ncbi:MAG: hypothetical protein ACPG4Z_00065 [Chitinophagales bacterium]
MPTCDEKIVYPYTVSIFPSIHATNKENWTSSPVLFKQYDFLQKTIEANPHLDYKIVEIKENNELIAQLFFQVVQFEGNELKSYLPENKNFLGKAFKSFVDCALQKVNWSLAVLGNIFITGENGQYWKKEVDAAKKWEIISEVTKQLADNENVDAFLISEIYREDWEAADIFISKKFRPFDVEPDMILDLDSEWLVFEDYLASFSSKYRVRCKKVLKNSKGITARLLSANDIKENGGKIHQLYGNVMQSIDFKLACVSPNYHYDIKSAFPSQYEVVGFFQEDELVGFVSFFDNPNVLDIHLIGLDYNLNKNLKIYQRILYDLVRYGIERKKAKVHFGRTASIIKSTVGAKPIKVKSFIKHNDRISNIVIKPLTTYLKPEPFIARNPFKEKK